MEKLLENIIDGRINDNIMIEMNYNNNIIYRTNSVFIEYTIYVNSSYSKDQLGTIGDNDGYTYNKYLPSFPLNGDIRVILKDGSIVDNDITIPVVNIERVIIFFPNDIHSIRFSGAGDSYKHRIDKITDINISNEITSMYAMFEYSFLDEINTSNFNTSNVTNMSYMFSYCGYLGKLDLSSFNTSKVTDMRGMFRGCTGLSSLDLSNFNTKNVTQMGWMFQSCKSLKSLDLSNWDTRNVHDMSGVFWNCSSLESLNLIGWDTSKVKTAGSMFYNVPSTCKIYVSDKLFTLGKGDFKGEFIRV